MTAVQLLEEALFIRVNGERASGGQENWRDWDRRAETFLRGLPPKPAVIGPFRDEYDFLSNFSYWPVSAGGVTFRTAEHYYQASKAADVVQWRQIANAERPLDAKRLGRKCRLRPDWEANKRAIMLGVVLAKFTQSDELRAKLLATGDAQLVEINTWGDTYWGVCDGKGENWLGRILMTVREVLS